MILFCLSIIYFNLYLLNVYDTYFFFLSSSSFANNTNNEDTSDVAVSTPSKLIKELKSKDHQWTSKLTVAEKQSPKKNTQTGMRHQSMVLIDYEVSAS
jgi:hypothetical protein